MKIDICLYFLRIGRRELCWSATCGNVKTHNICVIKNLTQCKKAEREREREREREKQRDRETDRERQRESIKSKEREREKKREKE